MRRIEILGASGVGKTTLFEKVLCARQKNDDFKTPAEARIQIIKSIYKGLLPLNRRSLIKYNILKKYHDKWALEILRKYNVKAILSSSNIYDGLIELFLSFLMKNRKLTPVRKLEKCQLYYRQILHDLILLEYFNVGFIIFSDAGILMHNQGIADEKAYRKILSQNPSFTHKINPTGIVYCKLSAETSFRRRKHRISSGVVRDIEIDLGDKELLASCKMSLESAEKKANVMKSLGVPVLEIDVAENTSKNTESVLEFIRSFY